MNRKEAEYEFQKKCFEPLFANWTQVVTEQYGKEYTKIGECLLVRSKHFLDTLAKLQNQLKCPVSILTFSVLWTSLLQGSPCILIEAYEGVPFTTTPVLSEKIQAPWLFYGWIDFINALQDKCGELALSTYIRSPEIRTKALEAAQNILVSYCMMMKAHLRQLPKTAEWQAVKKQIFFFVSAGEYMEQQLPLLGERPDVDLSYVEKGSDIRFSKFHNCVFTNQNFSELFLADTLFFRCTFQNVSFDQCALCDAIFIDCTFENSTLSNLSIMGTEFYASRFSKTTLSNVWSSLGQSHEKRDCVSCGRTMFNGCLLEDTRFDNSELNKVNIKNCQFLRISSVDSTICPALMKQIEPKEN